MADKTNKIQDNAEGKFYVDENCISCGVCTDTAPENFAMNDDDMAYVSKQPENGDEEAACREALEACPAEAIGDDG